MKVDITAGGQTKTFDLRARFGQPGAYTADIVPTTTGTWRFRFHGNIEGAPIDERFESGPGRFNDVEPRTGLEFPAKLPTLAQIAERLDKLSPSGANPQQPSSPAVSVDTDSNDTLAIALGVIGIAVGVVAGAIAIYALRGRQGGPASRRDRSEPV